MVNLWINCFASLRTVILRALVEESTGTYELKLHLSLRQPRAAALIPVPMDQKETMTV